MTAPEGVDYAALAAARAPTAATWDAFVREVLEPEWLDAYRIATPWARGVLEITRGDLVFLFDAAPTLKRAPESGDDRLVAVWSRSRAPEQRRDRARLADEAKRVASVAEEERRIIEAERRRLGLDA